MTRRLTYWYNKLNPLSNNYDLLKEKKRAIISSKLQFIDQWFTKKKKIKTMFCATILNGNIIFSLQMYKKSNIAKWWQVISNVNKANGVRGRSVWVVKVNIIGGVWVCV